MKRPSPDELLEGIQRAEEKSARGHLRVFFGMCPGVGKTFAMLEAAHEKQAEGQDIAVGIVETHGRPDTAALLDGLNILPRKKISYKDTTLEEMDLDTILSRRPRIVLVDELAHTNAPGSRHLKRYQDVQEILAAGIDVYTTLNVQHIESRADLVYQITGAPVQEKIPDSFLEMADQLELIDLSPEILLRRLKEGKVYLGERAVRAAENFFKFENIIALRELALRFTAEKVDEQLRSQMLLKRVEGIWNTNERLMVAVGYSPYSPRLIRTARRMAYNLEAPWIALYVDNGEDLAPEDQQRLRKNLRLAEELGAEIVYARDANVSSALRRVALEKNVTQIIIGRPDKRFFHDMLNRGTILDQLVRETSEIDIHVIRQERKPRFRGFHLQMPKLTAGFFPYWFTLWFMVAVSLGGYAILPWTGYRAIGFLFLAAVLAVGALATFGPVFFAASLAAVSWNLLFIPPQFTFAIKEPEDFANLLALFVVALVAGFLTSRIKRQERDLTERAHRSAVLYEFSLMTGEAKSIKELADHAAQSILATFNLESAIFLKKGPGLLQDKPENQTNHFIEAKDFAVATWTMQNGKHAGWGTDTLSSSRCLALPLTGRSGVVGVWVLWPRQAEALTLEQENLIATIAANIATGIERETFEAKAKEAEILEGSERLHQALLSSVSHELRTPLTSIIGNATALRNLTGQHAVGERDSLITDLVDSSERLNRVVENLLDMTRISSGALKVKSDLFEINDFVGSTLQRTKSLTKNHRLKFQPSDGELYVKGDDRLLEHVLVNLLANAAAYAPKQSEIEVTTGRRDAQIFVSVADQGPGLAEDQFTKVFDRFYRAPGTPTGGTGLGLSIARSLIEAQSGNIRAERRRDQPGCVFTFSLPAEKFKIESIGGLHEE